MGEAWHNEDQGKGQASQVDGLRLVLLSVRLGRRPRSKPCAKSEELASRPGNGAIMITPKFTVRQDADFVYVNMYTPYVKATEAEFTIDGDRFHCYVRPYFLRLTFPGRVVEDGREKASYDASTGHLLVTIPKAVPGEDFPDLDMLTTLLATRAAKPTRPNIEIVGDGADSGRTPPWEHGAGPDGEERWPRRKRAACSQMPGTTRTRTTRKTGSCFSKCPRNRLRFRPLYGWVVPRTPKWARWH